MFCKLEGPLWANFLASELLRKPLFRKWCVASSEPPPLPPCPLTPGQRWVNFCLTERSGDKCEAGGIGSSHFLCPSVLLSLPHPFVATNSPVQLLKPLLERPNMRYHGDSTSSWKWNHRDPSRWSKWAQVHEFLRPKIWNAPQEAPSTRLSAFIICDDCCLLCSYC